MNTIDYRGNDKPIPMTYAACYQDDDELKESVMNKIKDILRQELGHDSFIISSANVEWFTTEEERAWSMIRAEGATKHHLDACCTILGMLIRDQAVSDEDAANKFAAVMMTIHEVVRNGDGA